MSWFPQIACLMIGQHLSLWNLLRTGVKTILNRVGAGSLMLYARHLAMQKNSF